MSTASSARVQGITLKVEDVLLRLKDGSIRVPSFQRPLKWKREDNRLLFDSLLKSYPVGSLLMWVREAPPALVKLGPYSVDVQGRSQAWEVVDGQQRLTALAASLLPVAHRPAEFDFVVDLETGDVASPRNRPLPRWVPLAVLADTEKLIPFLHAHPALDVAKASSMSKRLREYPLSVSVLETDEQSFVEDVFQRLNTAGKRLTTIEVFRGRRANRKHGDAIARAVEVGNELQFGELDESNVLRAYKALSGLDPLADDPIENETAAESLVRGASEAVAFLKQNGVPIVELLPYSLPAGVLIAFFGSHRDVLPRNRQLLGYWFWRATFTFQMGGDFSVIRRLFRFATRPDQSEAVQELLSDIGSEVRLPLFEVSPTWRSAEGKMLGLVLFARRPVDLRTGEPIEAAALLWTQKLKAFRSLPVDEPAGVFTSILHPAIPKREVWPQLASASSAALDSHYLPVPTHNGRGFDEVRREILVRAFDNFLERKRGSDSLRPPLSALEEQP